MWSRSRWARNLTRACMLLSALVKGHLCAVEVLGWVAIACCLLVVSVVRYLCAALGNSVQDDIAKMKTNPQKLSHLIAHKL